MRLIDVDNYCKTICRCNRRLCGREKCPIHNLPTAYDIDKVVKELRERSREYNSGVRLHGKPEEMLTDDAVEIVKQGSVSDDVCEWHCDEYGRWHTECHYLADNDPLEYTYCPYCGKKIKQVIEESTDTDITEKYFGNKEWIDARYEVPSTNRYILMSFSNFSVPAVGKYELDENGGAFHIGNEDETCVSQDLFVNAWMELPERYKEE